jgi:LysR family transcriptional regulator, hydrogen peroxide-inducible genes activator
MNFRDLEYFLAIAEMEHFGRAADYCHVSQPTLSGQIKKLEDQLGVRLFERTNRKVMLTETGAQILESARRVLHEIDTIKEIAECSNDPLSGKFRLGAFPTLATYVFPALVQKVKKNIPGLRLILFEEKTATLIDMLRNGKIDATLLALPVHEDFVEIKELFDDEFYLAVPPEHELTRYQTIDQHQLKHFPVLLLEEGHCLRDQALEVCRLHCIAEEQDFKATGLETLRQMVKAGTGITFMPKAAISDDDLGIQYIPFAEPVPKRTIGLVWRKTCSKKEVIQRILSLF